jgi:hypothetical protein
MHALQRLNALVRRYLVYSPRIFRLAMLAIRQLNKVGGGGSGNGVSGGGSGGGGGGGSGGVDGYSGVHLRLGDRMPPAHVQCAFDMCVPRATVAGELVYVATHAVMYHHGAVRAAKAIVSSLMTTLVNTKCSCDQTLCVFSLM